VAAGLAHGFGLGGMCEPAGVLRNECHTDRAWQNRALKRNICPPGIAWGSASHYAPVCEGST
jgi:hypothetical protein